MDARKLDHLPASEALDPNGFSDQTARGRSHARIASAFFLAGFATFSLIYCVQPLLVAFSQNFNVGPAQSSLALSLTTGFLAAAILLFGGASESVSRRGLMVSSMFAAGVLNIIAAVSTPWAALLTARALEGFALGGVPAVAMAYLADEIDPKHLGLAMGLYIAGTAFGGMLGRVGIGMLADFTSWRTAMISLTVLDLVAAAGFALLLPPTGRPVSKQRFEVRRHWALWLGHLQNRTLRGLFLIGFLLMGAFVTIYNYAAYRLIAPPFRLSSSQISLIFLTYLFGIGASSIAGAMADRYGRGRVLTIGVSTALIGLLLAMMSSLIAIIAGVSILTIGFFMSHSVTSGWVGRSAIGSKGHAAALYLLAYYLGSSVLGSAGGWFWSLGRWPAVSGFSGILLLTALSVAFGLRRLELKPAFEEPSPPLSTGEG